MPSIAWSTVAVLALLLPGLFFSAGLSTPERFSRDLAPRNPVVALAAVVLVSMLVHAAFTGLSALAGRPVDWRAVLDAVQLPAGSASDPVGGAARASDAF
jgi:hypothetical protein